MKVLAMRLSPLPSSYFHIPTSLPSSKSTEAGEVRPQPSVPTDSETESSPFIFLGLSFLLWEMSMLPEALYPGCICVCAQSLQLCPTLCDPINFSPPGSFVYGDSPGKNTDVGYHALLQGIFPTQGSNQHLLHYTQILYPASHLGSSCFPKTVMNGGWGEKVFFFFLTARWVWLTMLSNFCFGLE